MTELPEITELQSTRIDAAVFRKMIDHLRRNPRVQNIDLMNVAYFCRNCFSKWYMSAARDEGIELDYDQAREIIYGMPYGEYKAIYQKEATREQLDKYAESRKKATE